METRGDSGRDIPNKASDVGGREGVLDPRTEGSDDDAILSAEENLYHVVVSDGSSSEQAHRVATDLVLAYNHLSMKKLAVNDIKGSLCLLQKAKLLTRRDQPFLGDARLQARALTLNNLGCLMKKWGKAREGIKFLARAIRIESEVPGGADNPAGTHLNMSAALSALGFHRAAAAHAGHAVHLASEALMMQTEGSLTESDADSTVLAGEHSSGECAGLVGVEGGVVSVGAADTCGTVSNSSDRGDSPSTMVGGVPEESRTVKRPIAGTISSAEADSDQSSPTSSSSTPNNRARLETLDKDEDGNKTQVLDNGVAGNPETSLSGDDADMEEPRSIERHEEPSSSAGGLLAIAFFNLGVEREHLGQLDAALSSYEDARVVADEHLGPESPVSRGIGVALQKASAAAVATASYSRKRAALRLRSAVSSFPAIGKLQFRQGTPEATSISDGRRTSPWRRRHQQHGTEISRDLLERAYSCARPCPAPLRVDSWSRLTRVLSPRSPPRAPASAPDSGGPQRAGRWTKPNITPAPPASVQWCVARGGGSSQRCSVDESLTWRARACAEWRFSPREALQVQRRADRGECGSAGGHRQ